MAPEIQTKEQEQVTQQQQTTEITKIISELESSNILVNVYDNYRVAIYDPHGQKETQEVIHYLVNTTMYKYLYNIVKAYTIVTLLHPKKVKKLLSRLVKNLEATKPEDIQLPSKYTEKEEEVIYYVFEDKLFLATLLAQLLYKRNNTLVTYLKLYYYFKVIEELENADIAVATFYTNIIHILKSYYEVRDEMPELARDLDDYDTGTKLFKREEILEELQEELKVKSPEEARNIILNEIKCMLKHARLDKQFIRKIKQNYKSKELVKVYKLLKQLNNYDEYDLIELEPVKTIKIKKKLNLDEYKKQSLKFAIEDYLKAAEYFEKMYDLERFFTTYEETNISYKTFEETLFDYLDEINIVKQGIFKYLAQQQQ